MYNGKPEKTETVIVRPTFQQLEQDLANIIMAARKRPEKMPESAFEAVSWFIRLVEGQWWGESLREKPVNTGGMVWIWPYADRVKYLLNIFLKADKKLQELVISAREDKIFWRGDDFEFFVGVIDETEKMREAGIVKYKKQAIASMKHAFAGLE